MSTIKITRDRTMNASSGGDMQSEAPKASPDEGKGGCDASESAFGSRCYCGSAVYSGGTDRSCSTCERTLHHDRSRRRVVLQRIGRWAITFCLGGLFVAIIIGLASLPKK